MAEAIDLGSSDDVLYDQDFDFNNVNVHPHRSDDDEENGGSVESETGEDHVVPVAAERGKLSQDLVEDEQQHESKDVEAGASLFPQSIVTTSIESFKYIYSMGLLTFSVVVVMAAIFTEQTTGTADTGVPTALAFLVFWFLIFWLAMMEGGQGALVGLQPIDKELYAESHPRTLKNTTLAHKGDNMERFIVGRQFLVVLVVFVINMMASAVEGATVLGLSEGASEFFLVSGISLILTTIMLGQLTAQVNAANCMLDFVNNYFMLFTTYVSLFIEFSGLLHSVYLVQLMFSKVTGTPVDSNEPPRNVVQKAFFWIRVLLSLTILSFSFAVTLAALFQGKTTAWEGIPTAVSVFIFFLLMFFVGLMDGMQIALFAVVKLPEEELANHSIAKKNCDLTFSGQNLQAFLIGRQILVTICMFVVARITTLDVDTADNDNIFGVSDGLQEFFNTGLLGAVITTIVGSLAWRVVASSFPLAFLSNPLIYLIIRLCLILEASGVCSASWLLAFVQKKVRGYQPDEVYIGARNERASSFKDIENDSATALQEEDGENKAATESPAQGDRED